MATPKTPVKKPAPKKLKASAPLMVVEAVPELPLESMDFVSFITQNLQARGYTEIDVKLEGFDGMFSLKLQGKNVHSALICTALKFTRGEAQVACFQAVEALADANTYADHQDILTPDFQP